MSFTFDWHKEPENFLNWMLVNLVTGIREDTDLFKKISEESKGFTNVTLTMQINGYDVPVDSFIKGIENNMEYKAQKAAEEMVKGIPQLLKLRELLDMFEGAVGDKVLELVKNADMLDIWGSYED